MSEPVRILIVEDAPTDFQLAQREIRKVVNECVFQQVQTREDFLRALDVFQPDLILSDYQMPHLDGMSALQLAQEHAKLTPFIIWTGTVGEDVAVELMRAGAANYILKENIKRLGFAVVHALEERRLLLEHKRAEETVHHNEKRFRALIENGRDNISLLAVDGTLLWESPATVRSLGYAQDKFLGHNIFELMHPDDLKWISDLYVKLVQEPGSRQDGDFRLRHRDGSWRWMEATVTNMLNEPGVNAIVANYRDITERRQAEEELHRSEERYRLLFENNPLPMWTYDLKALSFLAVNDAAVEKYGYTRQEFLQMTIADIRPPEEVSRLIEDVARQRPTLQRSGEWRHRLKDGTIIDVEITSHTLRIDEHDAALVVAQDITERKQAADRLNYHARLLRHINDAVIATDDKLQITAWNRAAEKVYGWTSEEVTGQTISEILSIELTEAQRAEARELLQESNAFRSEGIHQHKDGRPLYVEANTIALIDEHGKLTGYVSVNRDITERKRAEEQTQLQLQRLKSLRAIDIAISSSFNLSLTLDILLDQVIAQLKTDAAAILLLSPGTKTLEYAASRGFLSPAIRGARVRSGEGFIGRAILERRTIHIPNLMERGGEFKRAPLMIGEGFVDYYCVPLVVKGAVKGVLEIFHRIVLAGEPEWLDFLETLAGQAAIAIDNATLFKDLQHSNHELTQAYDATIEGWSRALDLRDKETEGHTQRVTEMTLNLARAYGLPEEQLLDIRRGALLHDIGKMGVPDNILLKPGALTEEEWVRMKSHPEHAYNLLKPITFLARALDIPYCHHEKWDGTGYPRGLKGEEIPLAARLFAVVDVWDALRSDRPYRQGWTREKTLEHIKSLSGTHLDPRVVECFLDIVQ